MKLTEKELERYRRHLVLNDFGVKAQEKLKEAAVLVVGAGGLGCPVLLYLAAAGVGRLGIVDSDTVQVSNLQRQILFSAEDAGQNKARVAAERIHQLNPHLTTEVHATRLSPENAAGIMSNYDVVVDGTDNFSSRYLINDACVVLQKPLVYGSILQYEGQLAVFNVQVNDRVRSTNYRDLFPQPPDEKQIPNCAEAGVLGVLPGIIGCMMATEVIKLITGIGKPFTDRLMLVDALTMEIHTINIAKRIPSSAITILPDYHLLCNSTKALSMKEITVHDLKAMMDAGEDFQLIDVREPYENEQASLGGELIPMAQIPYNVDRIDRNRKVVIHCRSGGRSSNIIQWLEKNHGFSNLYNLKGGILAWAKEIDPSIDVD
jgi:adenylyltransferase/sulfurtransferase